MKLAVACKGIYLSCAAAVLQACSSSQSPNIIGSSQVWHAQTFSFKGPSVAETATTFTNFKLDIVFTHEDGLEVVTPGYFAADGHAAESSASSGAIWQAVFVPSKPGIWTYKAAFLKGPNIAIKTNPSAATSAGYFDGASGRIKIASTSIDFDALDFRKHGMLTDVKERYLQFKGSAKYFIKTGAGSPENILAYEGFDNTYDAGGTHFPALGASQLHSFSPHISDGNPSDPTWRDGKGQNLLGAVNYLSDIGVNAQYMLLMNVEGDGQDVWPWIDPEDPYVYDVSKLAQWERVFTHMDQKGIVKDFLLGETENESWFEFIDQTDMEFADARKLYYREMVARFGHLLGLVWNLGEEQGVDGNSGDERYRKATTVPQRLAFAKYIADLDPYNHAIVSHNWPDSEAATYGAKLGAPHFSGISLQAHDNYAQKISDWTQKSREAGRPWIVTVDEPLGWEFGARPDADVEDRKMEIEDVLLPSLLAGGTGVSWYFGWQNNAPTSDLSNEDMRSRHDLWVKSTAVRTWWEANVPFHDMTWQQDQEAFVHNTPLDQPAGTIVKISMTEDGLIAVERVPSVEAGTDFQLSLIDPMKL